MKRNNKRRNKAEGRQERQRAEGQSLKEVDQSLSVRGKKARFSI